MRVAPFVLLLALAGGCSIKQFALNQLADALSGNGISFASDDDPELCEAAIPFSLKLVESVLAETPEHEALLVAACAGFTQYSYGFLRPRADELQASDLQGARALRARTKRLLLRAREYGLRALEVRHAGFSERLRRDPKGAASTVARSDQVAALYWLAAAWGLWISESKDSPDSIADQPIVEALIDRALLLDESFEKGAIHGFLITYEMIRRGVPGDPATRSRMRYERAHALAGGQLASNHVALAEAVSQPKGDKREFVALLEAALKIDPDLQPASRLQNILAQRRARWLLSRIDELFVE